MSTSDAKPVEQMEEKQDISKPNIQEEREAVKKSSLWKKLWNVEKAIRPITKGRKQDGDSQKQADKDIISDIAHISEAAEEVEENDSNTIKNHLHKLTKAHDEIIKVKDDEEKKEKLMNELRQDFMKLKLAIPQKYKAGAKKKDPLGNLKFKCEDIEWGGGAAGMMSQLHLHNTQVFGESMDLKDFVDRYNQLDSKRLKLCLLCFSIFPADAIIKKRLMVQWWVVEGYASTEKDAGDYFEKLMEKGFIEAVNDDRSLSVGSCRIHPFNRSALVALAERAKFFNFGAGGDQTQNFSGCFQACLMGAGLISYQDFEKANKSRKKSSGAGNIDNAKKVIEDESRKKSSSGAGNIDNTKKVLEDESRKKSSGAGNIIHNTKKVIEDLIKDLEKLHLVMNVDEHILEFIDEWFSKMKNLNYLYLGRWKASASHHIEVEDAKFLETLENMKYVKLLSFQGVSNVISLPDSIVNLTKLLVLDLRACYNLESIPQKIGSMKMLTHLDMSECYLLSHMPRSLSQLHELKVLKGFFVGQNPKKNRDCRLQDLKDLKHLQKLCIYTKWEGFPKEDNVKALGELQDLRKLTITWGPRDKESNVTTKEEKGRQETKGEYKLPKSLEKLDLKCFRLSETPDWLKPENLEHTQLNKLYIRGGNFCDLGQYEYDEKKSWKVKVLRLKYLAQIDMEWSRLEHLFPNLEYLQKLSCPNLTLFPCDANGVWIKSAADHQ